MEKQKNLKEEISKIFGVTTEAIDKMKGFDQALTIEPNKKYTVQFLEDLPREIEIPVEKQKFGKTKTSVISVTNLDDGIDYVLFCSPETLRIRLAQIAIKHNGSLKGVKVNLGKREVELSKWGLKNVYWVKEIVDDGEDSKKGSKVFCELCEKPIDKPQYSIEEDGVKKYYCEECAMKVGLIVA